MTWFKSIYGFLDHAIVLFLLKLLLLFFLFSFTFKAKQFIQVFIPRAFFISIELILFIRFIILLFLNRSPKPISFWISFAFLFRTLLWLGCVPKEIKEIYWFIISLLSMRRLRLILIEKVIELIMFSVLYDLDILLN